MECLFRKTTVDLTKEFTNSCSASHLEAKLTKVNETTGVQYTKVEDTIVLSGSWEQVTDACQLLSDWVKCENEVLQEDLPHAINACQMEKKTGYGVMDNHKTLNGDDRKSNQNEKLSHTKNKTANTESNNSNFIKHEAELSSLRTTGWHLNEENSKRNNESKPTAIQPLPSLKKIKGTSEIIENDKTEYIKLKSKSSLSDKGSQQNKPRNPETNVQNLAVKDSGVEGKACETKSKRQPGEKGYWSRVKIKNYNEKHDCSTCGVTLKSRKRYMEHMRRIHIKEFECNVCYRRFGYPTDLRRHKCPRFPDHDYTSKSKGGRLRKKKTCEQIEIPCQDCDFIGTSKKKLNDHIKRTHRLELSCDVCDRKFGFLRDLHRHKSSVHSDTFYFCDRCSKKYKSKETFQLHLKTHEEGYIPLKYPCQVCGKLFATRYSLNAHHKMEHLGINRDYLCQICGKKFRQRNSYKQHMNAHYRVKPYVCDMCGKAFTYHKSLKEHKFMHDNVRRFKCNICTKTFRQRTTLQIHLKVHKSIKDHICCQCGKGFSQKQALIRHERTHTGVRPYTCVTCWRKFGDASTIRRHMKAIHHKTDYNWREDISCNLGKRSDYYVLGGTGHNRSYKSKLKNENTIDSNVNTTKTSHVDNLVTKQALSSQPADKIVILVPPHESNLNASINKPSYTTYTELNNLQPTIQTSENIQTSMLPGLSCFSTIQHNAVPLNRTYDQDNGHVSTYFSSQQTRNETNASKNLKQESGQKNMRQFEIQPKYIDQHSTNLQTTVASSVEHFEEGIEPQRITYQAPLPNHPEATLNHTLASLWSMMGYQTHHSNTNPYEGNQSQ